MSQRQPRRLQASDQEGIDFGDVFDVIGAAPSTLSPSPTPTAGNVRPDTVTGAVDSSGISIGEALEAAAISVGDKPVDRGDVAAIRAAEARAAGSSVAGLGSKAQAAVNFNDREAYDYNKITISDVLSDATAKLPRDKAVTSEDADGVRGAEVSDKPESMPTPGGVADTLATAARVNQDDKP
ncbi:Late embryoproteinsis abundant protein D-34 [Hibiscus syriacus]|uniref:Late embryoproteinsis abundant protein D-34 n=1 Tax=Hibiscus syriacus TaxID=106335 RepID=A0A6A2XGH9_HIBSY|nr:late embryogenesis abundant protein 3-like [Hibiscus syriacus]KAE8675081.1 Late embryoproteinsis abundant protein D-34 [Hibiscus syriacus]